MRVRQGDLNINLHRIDVMFTKRRTEFNLSFAVRSNIYQEHSSSKEVRRVYANTTDISSSFWLNLEAGTQDGLIWLI